MDSIEFTEKILNISNKIRCISCNSSDMNIVYRNNNTIEKSCNKCGKNIVIGIKNVKNVDNNSEIGVAGTN